VRVQRTSDPVNLQFTLNFVVHHVLHRNESRARARLSRRCGAAAKASLNRAHEYVVVDPKPGDLPMSRVKFR